MVNTSEPISIEKRNEYRATVPQSEGSSFIERLAKQLGATANVTSVFGEPVERDGTTVIPVARFKWGFGGGEGTGDRSRWRWQWWWRRHDRRPGRLHRNFKRAGALPTTFRLREGVSLRCRCGGGVHCVVTGRATPSRSESGRRFATRVSHCVRYPAQATKTLSVIPGATDSARKWYAPRYMLVARSSQWLAGTTE